MSGALVGVYHVTGDPSWVLRITRAWARTVMRSSGIELQVVGGELLVPGDPCVFMSNHQSHVDIPTLVAVLPDVPGFIAKKELQRVPFLGKAMTVAGHVFVDRGKQAQAFKALADAAEQVRQGRPVLVFPEGTRGDGKSVRPLKKGGFHLARRAGVPIVPVGIRGTCDILPRNVWRMRPGTVIVHIGAPIAADEVSTLPLPELIVRTRREIAQLAGVSLSEAIGDRTPS